MNIGVTGPRPKNLGNEYEGQGPYSDYLRKEIRSHLELLQPELIYDGMAEGFDRLVVQVAIEMGINVVAAIPFVGQEKKWSVASQNIYWNLLNHRLVVKHYVCEEMVTEQTPYWQIAKWLQDRNVWIVDQLFPEEDKMIGCWDGRTHKSGTYNCLTYAWKKIPKENIVVINPRNAII